MGTVAEWASGLNSMGQEIRDPNAPAFKRLEQSVAYTLQKLEPISVKATRESDRSLKSAVMSTAGFSPVPKYVQETVTQGKVKQAYTKYNVAKQSPYDKYILGKEAKELQRLFDNNQLSEFDKLLDQVVEKYELTPKEEDKLLQRVYKNQDGADPYEASLTMFKSLPWRVQKSLLDQMSEEERDIYLPASNKDHLRDEYEPPAKKKFKFEK